MTEKKKASDLSHANAALKEEIAQRKLAEATTRKTLSLLNAALESTADGILVVDSRGKITGYQQEICEYVEYTRFSHGIQKTKYGNRTYENGIKGS